MGRRLGFLRPRAFQADDSWPAFGSLLPTANVDGWVQLAERPWDAEEEDGWTSSDRPGAFAIATDASAPDSPPNIGRFTYTTDMGSGQEPHVFDKGVSATGAVEWWTAWRSRWSTNTRGDVSGVNKELFYNINGGNLIYTCCFCNGDDERSPGVFYDSTDVDAPFEPRVHFQGVPAGPGTNNTGGVAGTNTAGRNLRCNLIPNFRFGRGDWIEKILRIRLNTAGNADGIVEWWVRVNNGTLFQVASHTDCCILPADAANRRLDSLQYAPTRGGAGPAPSEAYTLDVSRYRALGKAS